MITIIIYIAAGAIITALLCVANGYRRPLPRPKCARCGSPDAFVRSGDRIVCLECGYEEHR